MTKILQGMKSKDKKDNLLDHMENVFGELINHFP